jgi:Trk K+ transport system NAD-binding subunit
LTGVSIIGIWEGGHLEPAFADYNLNQSHVLVVAGRADQLEELDGLLLIYDINTSPVIVIGGGTVGIAATKALKKKDVPVHVIERKTDLRQRLKGICDRVFIGDGADYNLLRQAGIAETPSVLITTNDDAMNIFLTSYCRHLNQDLRIVSRITHERNLDAVHRAGANLVLRYSTLGSEAVYAILEKRELMLLGEGINFFSISAPESLQGRTLASSEIGARTGLMVLAIENSDRLITNPPPNSLIDKQAVLHMLGDEDQRDRFNKFF